MNNLYITDELLHDSLSWISSNISKIHSDAPEWSIVFCAYDEEKYLLPTLEALWKLTTDVAIEIIVVNNASNDRTKEILESSWVILINEKTKWISYARQSALDAAQWEIILQTDADTKVPINWIDSHVRHYKDSNIIWVKGGITFEDVHYLYYLYKWWIIGFHFFLNMINHQKVKYAWWANMSYRKESALSVWGFQPWTNLGEDILLFRKMANIGEIFVDNSWENKVITSWRRYDTPSKVISIIVDRILNMTSIINSWMWVSEWSTFKDIR